MKRLNTSTKARVIFPGCLASVARLVYQFLMNINDLLAQVSKERRMNRQQGVLCAALITTLLACTSCSTPNPMNFTDSAFSSNKFTVSGVLSLNSDLIIDVDEVFFRPGSVLLTNGYKVSIIARKQFSIDGTATIQGLSRSAEMSCANSAPNLPPPATDAISYERGPLGPAPAPDGRKGDDGRRGGRGLTMTPLPTPCTPQSLEPVTIRVLGDAMGNLTVRLGGGRGAPGASGQSGGSGGNGQEGGTCKRGETRCGWYGGFGGDGGSGTRPPNNLSVSGSGAQFTMVVEGDIEDFQLTAVDNWPGQIGDPGNAGQGGAGGLGGFFGKGGAGCEGLGDTKGMCMFPGASGMTAIATQGAYGRIGAKGNKFISPPSIERESCSGVVESPAAPEEYLEFWKALSFKIWGQVPDTKLSSLDGLPFLYIDDRKGIDALLPLPPIGNNAPSWKPFLPIETGQQTISKYYTQCLMTGTDRCPAIESPACTGWGCCLTPSGAVDTMPRAYPGCLSAFVSPRYFDQPSNLQNEPLGHVKALSLLPRILYREMAGLVELVDAGDLASNKLPGGTVYLKIATTITGSEDNKRVSVILLKLSPELFERMTAALSSSSAVTLEALSHANLREKDDGGMRDPTNIGLVCHDGISEVFLKSINEPLIPASVSKLKVGSGKIINAYGPKFGSNRHIVSIELSSFRGWTWIVPNLSGSRGYAGAAETCKFIEDARVRGDYFANCGADGPQLETLLSMISSSQNNDIRIVFANMLFLRAYMNFIGSNIPNLDIGLPCKLPIGIPGRTESFPGASSAKNLLGTICGLPVN